MSKDRQASGCAKYFDTSENSVDRLSLPVEPSFDFARGPATKEQLIEWVNCPDPDYQCPDVVQFDYQKVTTLISDCMANREKVGHLGLPSVFWRMLEENLVKAEDFWDFTLNGQMVWSPNTLEQGEHESVFTTATQLHLIFSRWYSKHGRGLNGTGDAVWNQVLAELNFSEAEYDCVRVSVEGGERPFFLWEADYPSTENLDSTITIQSPEIAAWFVLFSLHKVYRLFCLLVAEVLRGLSDGNDAELSHNMFEYWADIQAAMAVAQYWYDRIYSLHETLTEFEKRVSSDAETMTLEELKKPDAPLLHVGRLRLFNWFKNPSSSEAGFSQWQFFWMAKNGQLEPPNDTEWDHEEVRLAIADLHCSFQTAVMKLAFDKAVADFRKSHPYEKNLLLILDRKHSKPTAEDIEQLVSMLIGNEDGSAKTSFIRARKAVADYREKIDSFRKDFRKKLQSNTAKVRKKLIFG